MPKFITYQRPAPSARQSWKGGGKPGAVPGKHGTAPRPAPEADRLAPRIEVKLPGIPKLPRS